MKSPVLDLRAGRFRIDFLFILFHRPLKAELARRVERISQIPLEIFAALVLLKK
jgi:hypothetical protein